MKWVEEKRDNIYLALETDPENGLTRDKVENIQKEKGLNEFDEEKKESIFQKVLHHSKDVTTLILLVAAAISLYLAISTGHGYSEPMVIMFIVILNAILGIRQDMGAEKALDALKNMNTNMTMVIREGVKQSIDAKQLVPGDILVIEAGDMIPADARIIESNSLKVEESALTGESVPVDKDANAEVSEKAPIGDRINMIFSGCLVTNGRAKAVVVGTGMNTEMGKIAGLLNSTKKVRTPLQNRLTELGKKLSLIAIGSAVVLFIIGIFYGETIIEMLMTSVSLAVAAVPETLPIIVTIALAFGVQNMAKRNAIIRRIPAVETLGSTSVICSDKTGTLTENLMTIKEIWAVNNDPMKAEDTFGEDENNLLNMLSLANNATIENKDGEEKIIGDPTESAIIHLLKNKNISKESLESKYPRVFELAFDSERKLMTTIHKLEDGRYMSITKGAFDRINADCKSENKEIAKRIHDEFAEKALRVIAVGHKFYDNLPEVLDSEELERDLTFSGLVGIIDPPRPESKKAVSDAKKAGIRTVMITGDHIVTASAIAKEIGILEEGDKAITGSELAEMSEEELISKVREYSVYARVSPEDKIRIVKAWQANGEIVAMTGDGVNDAPALKAADVGVAMGISGTDVSKSAADMILTDDNFATIVDAVAEGRRVYENVRKTLYFLLSCNISEIFIMILAMLFGWGVPAIAIQLLLINVVADGIPGFALSREKAEPNIMHQKPIGKNESIFANGLIMKIAVQATVFTIITLLAFYLGKFVNISDTVLPSHAVGQTMVFVVLGWSSVVHIFNVRSSTQSIFTIGFTSNKSLFICACISIVIITLVATIPFLVNIFYLVPVSFIHWIIMIVLSIIPLIVIELEKLFYRRVNKQEMNQKMNQSL